MFKRSSLILLLVLGWCLFGGSALAAEAGITLEVKGENRDYASWCYIVDGHTMAPLHRLATELSAAQVNWDPEQQQIALETAQTKMTFTIGSRTAMVNGAVRQMPVAAYIDEDNRTYVPLRFLAEALGWEVSWDAERRRISLSLPDLASKVFAYYYYAGMDEVRRYADYYTDIAFRWLETDGQGNLFYEYQHDYAGILSEVKALGIRRHASVVLMGKEANHSLLSVPQHRQNLIEALVTAVTKDGYDGVNIDFELMAAADGSYLKLFLQQLREALPADKELSVAVYGRTAKDSWASPYDYAALGEVCDLVVIMAYDYSYTSSAPGPVAPVWWFENVMQYALSQMPAEKILMGFPTYGYQWPQGQKGSTVLAAQWKRLWDTYTLTGGYDAASGSMHYSYWDLTGARYDLWLEDERSYQAKLKLIDEYGVAGMSFWRIGSGFTNLYTSLAQWQTEQ